MSSGLQLRQIPVDDEPPILESDELPVRVELFSCPILRTYRLFSEQSLIELWCCCTADVDATALSSPEHTSLLSEVELERATRFREDAHRRAYLTTRFLMRLTLSHYADLSPTKWRFDRNRFGRPTVSRQVKPEISWHSERALTDFNLSRSGELVVCAVSHYGQVGVDIEDELRPHDAAEIATSVLAPRELGEWRQFSGSERSRVFLRYWVLKEAYVKALGVGLTLPLNTICFRDVTTSAPRLCTDPVQRAMRGGWSFGTLHLYGRYRVGWAHFADSDISVAFG